MKQPACYDNPRTYDAAHPDNWSDRGPLQVDFLPQPNPGDQRPLLDQSDAVLDPFFPHLDSDHPTTFVDFHGLFPMDGGLSYVHPIERDGQEMSTAEFNRTVRNWGIAGSSLWQEDVEAVDQNGEDILADYENAPNDWNVGDDDSARGSPQPEVQHRHDRMDESEDSADESVEGSEDRSMGPMRMHEDFLELEAEEEEWERRYREDHYADDLRVMSPEQRYEVRPLYPADLGPPARVERIDLEDFQDVDPLADIPAPEEPPEDLIEFPIRNPVVNPLGLGLPDDVWADLRGEDREVHPDADYEYNVFCMTEIEYDFDVQTLVTQCYNRLHGSRHYPKDGIVECKANMSMTTQAGPKGGNPIMPFTAGEHGNVGNGVPMHGDAPASSTVAGGLTRPNDPQVRASRDIPAQAPLMAMVGGPPDMSEMNMYQDDILNLVYRQFHSGTTTIQGSQALGSIVFRIPYGLNLLSTYGQNWARLHKRYNGRIRVTMSVSAVPMMRGNLLVGVVRNMPASTVTTYSPQALQKINWVILNVDGSGEYSIDIGDARKMNFFRDTSEDPVNGEPADVTDRPGIIGIVYTPLINQFGEDSDNSVVINFRSAAISPLEDPAYGFKCWEPIDSAVTLRSFEDTPSLIYVKDILPTIANRSLFLDGTKERTTSVQNLYDLSPRRGVFEGEHKTGPTLINQKPSFFSNDNKRFMVCLQDMDPLDFEWGANARPISQQLDYPYRSDIGSGDIVKPNPQNPFVGVIASAEAIPITNLLVTDGGSNSTNRVELTEVIIANYKKGRLIFCFGEVRDVDWTAEINEIVPVQGVNGLHTIVWPVGSDSATTTNNLPSGYYNVTVATDGQVQFLATIPTSPVLYPDASFTRWFLSLRNSLVGPEESITADLLDRRNNTLIGYLFNLKDQIVIRTPVPNNGSSHYRFNVDLQYLALANTRPSMGQPESDATRFLTPLDLTRGTSKYDIARAIQLLDRQAVDQLFALSLATKETSVKANAMIAGMAVAGGIAGLAQGAMSWMEAKNQFQNKLSLQDDYIKQKFKAQWDLNLQNFQMRQAAMGMKNFSSQPGANVANQAAASLGASVSHKALPTSGLNTRAVPTPTMAENHFGENSSNSDHDWEAPLQGTTSSSFGGFFDDWQKKESELGGRNPREKPNPPVQITPTGSYSSSTPAAGAATHAEPSYGSNYINRNNSPSPIVEEQE